MNTNEKIKHIEDGEKYPTHTEGLRVFENKNILIECEDEKEFLEIIKHFGMQHCSGNCDEYFSEDNLFEWDNLDSSDLFCEKCVNETYEAEYDPD